jgi:hypothetical protein
MDVDNEVEETEASLRATLSSGACARTRCALRARARARANERLRSAPLRT